jgi:aspartate-semialdehyde dehydrogenase
MFDLQYAFNLFSHNAPILSNGYNEEEMKLVKETRKIWVSFKGSFLLRLYLIRLWFSPF